jgi:hypothetical protein
VEPLRRPLGLLGGGFFAASLLACPGGPNPTVTAPTATSQNATEMVILAVGASVDVAPAGLTITFVRVEDDSRCPTGVTCVWEGDAVVVITVSQGAQAATTLRLHVNPASKKQQAEHAGHVIRLIELTPYPAADSPIKT